MRNNGLTRGVTLFLQLQLFVRCFLDVSAGTAGRLERLIVKNDLFVEWNVVTGVNNLMDD